ncbi:MAG: VCBS repeat-containing protein [Saprospiraceae bacterium]|nr:VCBS repeat-containing protein [Saprospiraceae bacterium]
MKKLYLLMMLFLLVISSSAQIFKRLDFSPVTLSTFTQNGYHGAAWGELNADGYPDLVTSHGFLYLSDGSGGFTISLIDTAYSNSLNPSTLPGGIAIADYDNDGFNDLFIAGVPAALFQNDGTGHFIKIVEGAFGHPEDSLPSWTVAVADADLNGFVDAVFTHPAGFIRGIQPRPSLLMLNHNGLLNLDTTYGFTSNIGSYTTATWIDYDDDRDQDLFIASGPANSTGLDSLYTNVTSDSGFLENFLEPSNLSFSHEQQNGQLYNGVDLDNDLDIDIILTNYNRAPNRVYKNDDGNFYEIEVPFTVDGPALTNTWGDLDNDGDQDVILSYDLRGPLNAYLNDGQGNFTYDPCIMGHLTGGTGIVLADYDKDGLLDMYESGWFFSRALFHNILSTENNWVQFDLEGTQSNRSAIGAKIFLQASINGKQIWQRRDVSTQNSFNGHNDLRQHFGLGDANTIDSVIIFWPGGLNDTFTNLNTNSFYHIIENDQITSNENVAPLSENRIKIFPNPSKDTMQILFDSSISGSKIRILDVMGKQLFHKALRGEQSLELNVSDWPRGTYYLHSIDKVGNQYHKPILIQ